MAVLKLAFSRLSRVVSRHKLLRRCLLATGACTGLFLILVAALLIYLITDLPKGTSDCYYINAKRPPCVTNNGVLRGWVFYPYK